MTVPWLLRALRPDYTWPQQIRHPISETTPAVPQMSGRYTRIAWGFVHRLLFHFSKLYCYCYSIPFERKIVELPFGLVMKWTDRTSIEEVAAMQMVHAAAIPAPWVLCYGEHPYDVAGRTISILMTRLPGFTLANSSDPLVVDEEGPWLEELKTCVDAMRKWDAPDGIATGSVIGTSVRSARVPDHVMGPFANVEGLYEHLFAPSSSHGFASPAAYEEAKLRASKLREGHPRILFTNGDFKAHNILISDDGHLSGFLDWESGGWYPEFWEFTTAMRFGRDSWWFQVASWIGGKHYLDELAADVALNLLTVDSYIAF